MNEAVVDGRTFERGLGLEGEQKDSENASSRTQVDVTKLLWILPLFKNAAPNV